MTSQIMYKLLHSMSTNSKLNSKLLSKEISTSQQNVSHLIKKLKEDNIISEYQTLIDPSRFGFDSFIVLLRLKNSSPKTIQELNKVIINREEITGFYSVFGSFEIILKFTNFNASSFNKSLKSFLVEIKDYVIGVEILTQIVEYYFSATYLSKRRIRESILIGADRKITPLNAKELYVLQKIQTNSRMSSSKIAINLETTAKTVIEIIKKLEKKEVIKGTITMYHPEEISEEINQYLIFIRLPFSENENKVLKFLKAVPYVTKVNKVFGEWDFVIQFETFKVKELQYFLESLKEEYTIDTYKYVTITKRFFWRSIPKL